MKNSLESAILFISSLLISLSIAEFVLNYMDIPHFYERHSSPPQFQFFSEADRYRNLGYINKPSTTIRFVYDGNPRGYFGPLNEVDHKINSMGLRTRQNLPKHTSRTFRIVFLGDSFTFGEGVHERDTYPMQVETILSAQFPDLAIESLNFGVGGYNTSQEAELLRFFGLKVEPDLVVLGYTANDANPNLYFFDPSKRSFVRQSTPLTVLSNQPNRPPDTFLFSNFRIPQLVWLTVHTHQRNRGTVNIYRSLYRENSPGWQKTQRALHDIGNLCTTHRLPCYAVVFPNLFELDNYPLRKEHNLVKDTLQKHEFSVIDLLPALRDLKLPDADLWVHPTDQHPNEIVHKRVAELIVKRIEDEGLLDMRASKQPQ